MAILIELRNPPDLDATFDQLEIERATELGGSYANVTTEDISVTNETDISPGYTSYDDSAGDADKYYRARFTHSVSGIDSPYTEEFRGGFDVLDALFRRRMRDTNSNKYFFTDNDVQQLRINAIGSLWPAVWIETYDESLTTDGTTMKFTFPSGVFRVNNVEFLDSSGNLAATPGGWSVRGKEIIFRSAPSNGYTLRLLVEKKMTKFAECPQEYDGYLLDFMRLEAFKEFEADRSQFYKYNSVVKAEGGNLPSIRLTINQLQESTKNRLESLRRVRRAAEIG